jgi:predicted nucleic acid-binding protein
MRRILIDSGILLSYFQQQEPLHQAVVAFFDQNAAQLITSPICIAEVLWLLGDPGDRRNPLPGQRFRCLSALSA